MLLSKPAKKLVSYSTRRFANSGHVDCSVSNLRVSRVQLYQQLMRNVMLIWSKLYDV